MLPKLMFLGNEACGKSTAIEALKYMEANKSKEEVDVKAMRTHLQDLAVVPTEGVVQGTLTLNNAPFSYWDFSGNAKYLNCYPLFLTERSLYFIFCNINCKLDLALKQWVQTVHFYTPKSQFFVVGTHRDTIKKSKDKERVAAFQDGVRTYLTLLGRAKQLLGVLTIGTLCGSGYKDFVRAILAASHDKQFAEAIPEEYFLLKKEIERQKQRQPPLLSWSELIVIANECWKGKLVFGGSEREKSEKEKSERTVTDAIKFLETLGTVMYFPGIEDNKKRIKSPLFMSAGSLSHADLLGRDNYGFVLTDPIFLSHIFSVIHSRQFKTQKGVGLVSNLTALFKNTLGIPANLHDKLLELLEFFDMIFRFSDGNLILIPEKLEASLPNIQRSWPTWDPSMIQLDRIYSFSFFPYGLFSRFSLRMLQHFGSEAECWKQGMIIRAPDGIGVIRHQRSAHSISISVRANTQQNPLILFCSLVDHLTALMEHQFHIQAEIILPCSVCLACGFDDPYCFPMQEFRDFLSQNQKDSETITCKHALEQHEAPIISLAPDLILFGISDKFELDDVVLDKKLGQGGFASVFHGVYRGVGVAVKILTTAADVDSFSNFRHEVSIMAKLKHNNLVALRGISMKDPPAIALEYVEFGALHVLLGENHNLDLNLKVRFAFDIALGLSFMHGMQPPLVHCDLKSPNILIASLDMMSDCCAKICDFGTCKPLFTEKLRGRKSKDRDVMNPTWLSPEVIEGKAFDCSADIYAFGIILWEILTQDRPFAQFTFEADIEDAVLKGQRPEIPIETDFHLASLLRTCWHAQADQRPTIMALVGLIEDIISQLWPTQARAKAKLLAREAQMKTLMERGESYASMDFSGGGTTSGTTSLTNSNSGLTRSGHDLGTTASSSTTGAGSRDPSIDLTSSTSRKSLSSTSSKIPSKGKLALRRNVTGEVVKKVLENFQGARHLIRTCDSRIFVVPHLASLPDKQVFAEIQHLERSEKCHVMVIGMSPKKFKFALYSHTAIFSLYSISLEFLSMKEIETCIEDVFTFYKANPKNYIIFQEEPTNHSLTTILIFGLLFRINSEAYPNFKEISLLSHIPPPVIPSIRRYAAYACTPGAKKRRGEGALHLHKIVLNVLPIVKFQGGCDPLFSVCSNAGQKLFFSKKIVPPKKSGASASPQYEFFCRDVSVSGDLQIQFFHRDVGHLIFSFQINLERESIVEKMITFNKHSLDLSTKDFTGKCIPESFKMTLYFISFSELTSNHRGGRFLSPHRQTISMGSAPPVIIPTNVLTGSVGTATPISTSPQTSGSFASPQTSGSFPSLVNSDAASFAAGDASEMDRGQGFCNICNHEIDEGESAISITVAGIVHSSCLKCCYCGHQFHGDSFHSIIMQEKLICQNCNQDYFPSCIACQSPIKIGEKKVTLPGVSGYNWHSSCINCYYCALPIMPNSNFTLRMVDGRQVPCCCACERDDTLEFHDPTELEEFSAFLRTPTHRFREFIPAETRVLLDLALEVQAFFDARSKERRSGTPEEGRREEADRLREEQDLIFAIEQADLPPDVICRLIGVNVRPPSRVQSPPPTNLSSSTGSSSGNQPSASAAAFSLSKSIVQLQKAKPSLQREKSIGSSQSLSLPVIQRRLLSDLVTYYQPFVKSTQFEEYQASLTESEEEAEDAMRRVVMQDVVPVSKEQLKQDIHTLREKLTEDDEEKAKRKHSRSSRRISTSQSHEKVVASIQEIFKPNKTKDNKQSTSPEPDLSPLEKVEAKKKKKSRIQLLEAISPKILKLEKQEGLAGDKDGVKKKRLISFSRPGSGPDERNKQVRGGKRDTKEDLVSPRESSGSNAPPLVNNNTPKQRIGMMKRMSEDSKPSPSAERRERPVREQKERSLTSSASEVPPVEKPLPQPQPQSQPQPQPQPQLPQLPQLPPRVVPNVVIPDLIKLPPMPQPLQQPLPELPKPQPTPPQKQKSKQYLELEERVAKRSGELRELQLLLFPIPEAGAKTLQQLRMAPFPLRLSAPQRTHHSITKMQLLGSEKAFQGTAHYLVLQSFAGTETVEYPDPEKCLNPIITCSNGKRCFPFYSTNHDKTLTIGFFASEEGTVDVKVLYLSHKGEENCLSTKIIVSAPVAQTRDWRVVPRGVPTCNQLFEIVLQPLSKACNDDDPIQCLRIGNFPPMDLEYDDEGNLVLSATPTVEGKFTLHVTVNGVHVLGSPYQAYTCANAKQAEQLQALPVYSNATIPEALQRFQDELAKLV